MKNIIKKVSCLIMIFVILSGSFHFFNSPQEISPSRFNNQEKIHSSGQTLYSKEWLKNNDFSTQDEWILTKGVQGDNSTVDAYINSTSESANFKIVGENNTFGLLTGDLNSSTWDGWGIYNNSDFLLPDVTEINATGLYVYHYLDESEGPNSIGQVHNFPSVHFRKNISLNVDMSDYEIKSASIESIFNASVAPTVDTEGDIVDFYSIWDSATFYMEISDLNMSYSFRVAQNKTTNLGQDSPPILNINDRALDTLEENDLITALNLALEKDPNHSSFTIILGIDIYCEDNLASGGGDRDEWYALIFKSLNLTFTFEKKIDQFSSVSLYQVGNIISGANIQLSEAHFTFKVKIGQLWSTILSPFSEMRILINDNLHTETLRLGTLNTTFNIIMFDVSSLISKDVNISLEIQVFMANTFSLGKNITISIDDVFLNISYYETFDDYTTNIDLFLNNLNKTQDRVIQIPINSILNVTIKYSDNQTGFHIPNATVQLGGDFTGSLNENFTLEQYSIIFNTSQLSIGIKSLTVEAKKDNYETRSLPFFVEVVDRTSELLLFVNNNPINNSDTVNIGVNDILNVTVEYRDNSTKQNLSGASVELLGVDNLTETSNYYNITINSNDLDLGFNVLIIIAQLENYTSQTFQIFIELNELETELGLFVNNNQLFESDTLNVLLNEILNITVFFQDNLTKQHLSGASVELLGFDNLTETSSYYNITINANDLEQGINVLIINAQLENYTSQTSQFFIKLNERETELGLFVNNIQHFESDTLNVVFNEILNITVDFQDNLTKQHLSGASVELLGVDNLTETSSYYNITINANDLEQGINVLIINAQLENYTSQTIQFFIELNERETNLLLFVNNTPTYDGDTIVIKTDEILDVAVFYRDGLTDTHLSGASVDLLGVDSLTETVNSYIITITAEDLNPGITIFIITAQLNNYQSQTIQIYVEVVERATELQVFLNMESKTLDPVIELPLGSVLNITIKYTENQSGLFIENSLIQLIGEGLSINFIENLNYKQHSFILNTTILKIGVNLLTIVANATNFQIGTIDLRITIKKITAVISSFSGEPYINIIPGENARLRIKLNDSDFGAPINNATVIYRWTYGQGELTDQNNDGIYEADLYEIPEGSYIITITASAGDNYNFKSYEITVSAIRGVKEDQSWLIYVLIAAIMGVSGGITVYQLHFKYPPLVRKIRKLRKSIRKGKKTKAMIISKREETIKVELQNQTNILEKESENIENKIRDKNYKIEEKK